MCFVHSRSNCVLADKVLSRDMADQSIPLIAATDHDVASPVATISPPAHHLPKMMETPKATWHSHW